MFFRKNESELDRKIKEVEISCKNGNCKFKGNLEFITSALFEMVKTFHGELLKDRKVIAKTFEDTLKHYFKTVELEEENNNGISKFI